MIKKNLIILALYIFSTQTIWAIEPSIMAVPGPLGADTVTAQLNFTYPICTNTPTKITIFYQNSQNIWEEHNTCFTNIASGSKFPGLANCMWKYPLPVNTNPNRLRFRAFNVNSNDCTYSTEYKDYQPTTLLTSSTYKDYDKLITGQRPNYKIKFSTRGGAIYEYYNKRADSAQNVIHADLGAALQLSIHTGAPNTFTGCLGQGYYNPTQAGAGCQYPPGASGPINDSISPTIFNVFCDGVHDDNDTCRSITSTSTILQRMMNYDYGPQYRGPYNDGKNPSPDPGLTPIDGDTTSFSQLLSLEDDYAKINVSFSDSWDIYRATHTHSPAAVAAPGAFFSNMYGRYYYQNAQGQIIQADFPVDTGDDSKNFNTTFSNYSGWFFTAENPNLPNSSISIVYQPDSKILSNLTNRGKFLNITQPNLFDQKVFTLGFDIVYQPSDTYTFTYYIFPYKYNEIVNTPMGTMTVQQFAEKINEAPLSPAPTPKPGDLNGDGKVDLGDFNKIKTEFGRPYTIFDYNILVGNFGK